MGVGVAVGSGVGVDVTVGSGVGMGVAMGSGAGVGVGAGSGAAVDVAVEVSLGVGVVWSQATSAMTAAQINAARPNHALIGTPNAREAKVLPSFGAGISRANSALQ